MNPFNPFDNAELSKLMADFKMPGMDVEGVVGAYRRNLEAIAAASQVATEGMQAVVQRQTEILRDSMAEYASMLRDYAAPRSPEEAAAKQLQLAKRSLEAGLAHMREISEMIAKTNNESLGVLNKRVSEMMEEFKRLAATTPRK